MSSLPTIDPILSTADAARILGRSPHTLRQDRSHGRGPAYLVHPSGQFRGYRWSVLQAYIDGLETSTPGTPAERFAAADAELSELRASLARKIEVRDQLAAELAELQDGGDAA